MSGLSLRRLGRILLVFAWLGIPSTFAADALDPCTFGRLRPGSRAALKAHQDYHVAEARNDRFIEAVHRGEPFALFFHLENAVLKAMNDVYFKDKEVSAALMGLYERILMEKLRERPELAPDLVYSDYKSLRFAYEKDSPALREGLARLYGEAAAELASRLAPYRWLRPLYDYPGSAIAEPAHWHLGGFGATADEAAAAARYARRHDRGIGLVPLVDFRDPAVHESLSRLVALAERTRHGLVRWLGEAPRVAEMLVTAENGQRVLSEAVIDLLRRRPPPDELGEWFSRRFGLDLPADRAAELLRYLDLVDAFAPSIYERAETLNLRLEQGVHGLVAADLAGQNVRNLQAAMAALAGTSGKAPESLARQALRLARAAQDAASARFEERRGKFLAALNALGIRGLSTPLAPEGIVFSGDDGVFLPDRVLSPWDKQRLLELVAEHALSPSDFRLTFVDARYARTGQTVPAEARGRLVSEVESVEKLLRRALEREEGIAYGRLKGVAIGLDVRPLEAGSAEVRLYLGGETVPGLRERAERRLREMLPEGYRLGGNAAKGDEVGDAVTRLRFGLWSQRLSRAYLSSWRLSVTGV